MKRNIFVFLFLSSLTFSGFAQKQTRAFELKGSVLGLDKGVLFLSYSDANDQRVLDSTVIANGKFYFKGKVLGAEMAYLSLKETKRSQDNDVGFFIEPVSMNVTLKYGEFRKAVFEGSKVQAEYAGLRKQYQKLDERWKIVMDTLTAINNRSNTEYQETKNWALVPYNLERDDITLSFFNSHPQSYVTAYLLRFYVSSLPIDSLQMFYDRMGSKLQQSADGKNLADEIKKLRSGSPGSMAANFTKTDIEGKIISLSDFKGKYVLLDFWASWCVPCRKGNPHLKKLYSLYKEKGFEIIGISDDDRNHEAWKKAVEKDALPWRHVLRGLDMDKRLKNEPNPEDISEKYGIHSLPTKILINPEGIIIGRYGEEESALDKKLEELFSASKK